MRVARRHPVHPPIVERSNEPSIIFLTACAQDRKCILANPEVTALLQDSWAKAAGWTVGHFLVMPDHVHLFCSPGSHEPPVLKRWVQYWKTLASRRWPRRAEHPIWQLNFWDTQLRSVAQYIDKWEYVRLNPVCAGLVNDSELWPYRGTLNDLYW